MMFLKCCEEQGVKLDTDQLNIRLNEVPFIGYVSTGKGRRIYTAKLRAISEMLACNVVVQSFTSNPDHNNMLRSSLLGLLWNSTWHY